MGTTPNRHLLPGRALVLAASLCVIDAIAVHAAAPPLAESVVVRGSFGAAPEQFGRAGIEASGKTIRLVNCFAVSSEHIAVHDRVKRDVKVFGPTGVFETSVSLRLTVGAHRDTVRARDIALDGDVLYVLVDDLPDGSKQMPASLRLASFSVGTGVCRDVHVLETAPISPAGKPTARGVEAFLLHPFGDKLWLVDTIRQMSFEVVPNGGAADIGKHVVFGWGGEHRVRTDDTVSSINLLDADGRLVRRLPQSGVLVAVSQNGGTFAVLQTAGGADWSIELYDAAGDREGSAPRPNRSWKPFRAPVMERKYEIIETPAGPELYEMYAGMDGVRVVRWSRAR